MRLNTETLSSVRRKQGNEKFGRYLQVLNAELVSIHVNGGQKDGLHLVVTQLVGRQMGSNENLANSKHQVSARAAALGHGQEAPAPR